MCRSLRFLSTDLNSVVFLGDVVSLHEKLSCFTPKTGLIYWGGFKLTAIFLIRLKTELTDWGSSILSRAFFYN